ncbi:uncharacterized protein LOC143362116 [Halictus rubicundus]|uniref:uncharacterized protein LOC143362116 n=1 Tax=Halictus rubicundus TaxID=77578 RepID=UPI0040361232
MEPVARRELCSAGLCMSPGSQPTKSVDSFSCEKSQRFSSGQYGNLTGDRVSEANRVSTKTFPGDGSYERAAKVSQLERIAGLFGIPRDEP